MSTLWRFNDRWSAAVLLLLTLSSGAACRGAGTAPSGGTTNSGSSSVAIAAVTVQGSPVAEVLAGPYQFVALAQMTNGTYTDATTLATWSSSNQQVANFTMFAGRPVMYTYRAGTIVVTATYGGRSGSINVTVL